MSEDEQTFNAKTCAQMCGISDQAFQKWGLRPVRIEGRESFYSWPQVRQMWLQKMANRTRQPAGIAGPSDVDGLTSVRRLAGEIGDAAEEALAAGDLEELTRQLARMQGLAAAAGIEENGIEEDDAEERDP